MKKTRIRRLIVREIKTTVLSRHEIEKADGEIETSICPLCHSPIHSNQINEPSDKKLLDGKNLSEEEENS